MEDKITELLSAAKLLLGIKDDESDELLTFLINDTIDAVMSYCHIDVMPRQLEGFIPSMAAARCRENAAGGVVSLTEGERRVEYGSASGGDFMSAYKERLKPFMSHAAFVPSDLEGRKNA